MSLSSPSVIVGVVLIIVSVARGEILKSPCTYLGQMFSHPTDCKRYMECSWGQLLDRPCAPGTVFSFRTGVCVFPWDKTADTCLKTQDSVPELCSKTPSAVFAHPSKCHQFYNCSGNSNLIYYPSRPGPDSENFYLFECPYAQLFNEDTLQCEDYRQVQCGQRFEPVDKCEYTRYQCQKVSHCIPCEVHSPSCKDLPDGINVYRGREWTPYISICENQRLVNTSTCPRNEILTIAEFFSPDFGECVPLYEVPVEHGGYYLNCTGRPNGLYADDVTNRPNLYFQCVYGTQVKISLCPEGQLFNQQTSSCKSPVQATPYIRK